MRTETTNTKLLWWARFIFGFVALNAFVGAIVLIFLSTQTDQLFFWSVRPPINAGLFGALYLGGATAVSIAVYRNRWEPMRYLVPFLVAAGILISWVTLLHLGKFASGIRLVYWLLIYIGAPLLAVLIYAFQERRGANWAVIVPVRPFTSYIALISGTIIVLVSVLIILWPETAVANWPWQTSPLMVRIFAAWFGAFGVGLLWFKVERDWRRLSQIPNLMIAAAGLDLLMVFVHRQTVFVDRNFWIYCSHLILFALIGGLLHWSQSRSPVIKNQISIYELSK